MSLLDKHASDDCVSVDEQPDNSQPNSGPQGTSASHRSSFDSPTGLSSSSSRESRPPAPAIAPEGSEKGPKVAIAVITAVSTVAGALFLFVSLLDDSADLRRGPDSLNAFLSDLSSADSKKGSSSSAVRGSSDATSQEVEANPDRKDFDDIPQAAKQLMVLGNREESQGDFDGAFRNYTAAIAIYPNFAEAFANRGNVWLYKRQYDLAIADFTEAIRLNRNLPVVFRNRSIAWVDKGDFDQAIKDLNQAIHLKPDYGDAFANRAHVWIAKGEYDRAISDSTEAIRLNSSKSTVAIAYSNRAAAWEAKGEQGRAISDWTEASCLKPDLPAASRLSKLGVAVDCSKSRSR